MMYQCNPIGLAQYLSDLKLKFTVARADSNKGYRKDIKTMKNCRYDITINKIVLSIVPRIDTFVSDKELQVQVVIPKTEYEIRTNEVSDYYPPGETLGFGAVFKHTAFSYATDVATNDTNCFAREYNKLIKLIKSTIVQQLSVDSVPTDKESFVIHAPNLQADISVEQLIDPSWIIR